MRLVLDTNVLVAAFISHGVCHELLEHCALRHEIILSEPILAEFERILVEKFGFGPTEIRQAVRLLRSRAAMVTPARLAAPVSRDSDDDVVLATALVGGCDGVVSGDRDLSDLESYQGMRIMTPTQFWAFEKDEPEGERFLRGPVMRRLNFPLLSFPASHVSRVTSPGPSDVFSASPESRTPSPGLMVSSFRSPVSVVSANHGLSDGFSATRDSRPTIHGRRGATLLELLVVLLIMLILFAITAAAIYKTRARSKTTLADTFKEHNETLTK